MDDQGPRDGVLMPGVEVLRAVFATLDEASIVAALGGSGLLAALGLTDRVRDWDVTTDADPDAVVGALAAAGVPWASRSAGDGRFATRARLLVDGGDHDIEILVGFALRTSDGIHPVPTRVTGSWNGLPVADPHVWADAYRLMGRDRSAAVLDAWLARRPDGHRPDL